ncbi:MAG: alkaline phosphatase D family protein [Burkholderiaceae bacterium]|nr:alkaline phosphatase D family protein [Burkholderiaceae bacterium]
MRISGPSRADIPQYEASSSATDEPASPQRRRWLAATGAGVLAAPWLVACQSSPPAATSAAAEPGAAASGHFASGVASGEPTPDRAVIWTRALPPGVDGASSAIDAPAIELDWEVATDPHFAQLARRGRVRATAARNYCVHVDVDGLAPERRYWYRFRARDMLSPVGRFRTAPASDAPAIRTASWRIAVASCQHWEYGFFGAHRDLVEQAPDLVLFVGDYIYESGARKGRSRVRHHEGGACRSLADYRRRYAQYRSDPLLQASHAACAWLTIWDDHEVVNDYAGLTARVPDPELAARRAAAYRAWLEFTPTRAALRERADTTHVRIYQTLAFGEAMRITLLDGRQYRSEHACKSVASPPGSLMAPRDCAGRLDPSRSLLGLDQERWLDGVVRGARERWHLIAQTTLFSPLFFGPKVWLDGWDGYAPARDRLVDTLARSGRTNPVLLGGDVHSGWIADIKRDYARFDSATVATEICSTSITSPAGLTEKMARRAMDELPYLHFGHTAERGYTLLEIGPARIDVSIRATRDVRVEHPTLSTLARFTIDAARPGAHRVA